MLGSRRTHTDPDHLEVWQVGLLTGIGLAAMLVASLFGLGRVALGWWVAATAVWLAVLAVPAAPVRRHARERGWARTVLWAPLVGPYALGAALFLPFELLG